MLLLWNFSSCWSFSKTRWPAVFCPDPHSIWEWLQDRKMDQSKNRSFKYSGISPKECEPDNVFWKASVEDLCSLVLVSWNKAWPRDGEIWRTFPFLSQSHIPWLTCSYLAPSNREWLVFLSTLAVVWIQWHAHSTFMQFCMHPR